MQGCRYGTHRVMEPKGVLPQAAQKIDSTMTIYDNELLIDVETLNIDSASFTQLKQACGNSIEALKEMILEIVSSRGKMQNPVTGSGGMLLGKIAQIGRNFKTDLQLGDEIATLVSLSLTPLKIDEIRAIDLSNDQVRIKGQAILFESGIFAKIPQDLDRYVVLSALDVAGAAMQTKHLVKSGDSVLILGAAGKSGLLCSLQAKLSAGPKGNVIGIIYEEKQRAELQMLQACDHIIVADARNPIAILEAVKAVNHGEKVDVTINVVNVPNTEMSSILPTKDSGKVYFFSMATSFQKAALGAEGIASEATLLIGNGYSSGHSEWTLHLLRNHPTLLNIFQARYGKESSK